MLVLDSKKYTANGKELSRTEWEILKYLKKENRIVSKQEILKAVYPGGVPKPNVNTIEVYVKYIRDKIGKGYIKTRTGFGYYVDLEGGE